jgi:hypothetical protein
MKLQLFNGGKATRKAPHLIGMHEAVSYINVDNESGSLVPVKTKLASGIMVDQYATFFNAQQEWISSATVRDYVELQSKLYWTDRSTQPQKYDGTNTYQLGVSQPTTEVTGVVTESPAAITRITLAGQSASGNLPASTTFSYIITNKSTVTGLTSLASVFSITTTAGNNQIHISAIDTNFANEAKIYRFFDGAYKLVDTFTSASDTFTDSVFDISANTLYVAEAADLTGTVQYAYTYYNSAEGVESALSPSLTTFVTVNGEIAIAAIAASADPQVDKKRLYRLGGALTVFSLVTTLDNATLTYNDSLNDAEIDGTVNTSALYLPPVSGLQFLTEANGSLFGSKGSKLYYSEVGLPDAFPTNNFISFPLDIAGMGDTANGMLVFTKNRTYIVTGTSPSTYSKYLLSGDQGCIAFESVANIGPELLWVSNDGICTSSGDAVTVITKEQLGHITLSPVASAVHDEIYYLSETGGNVFALDFRYGNIAKDLDLDITSVVQANDVIYGWNTGQLHELFKGASSESLTYLSAEVTDGEYSNLKTYKSFYIRYDGTITLEIFIDGVSVLSKVLSSSLPTEEIKVPSARQQGYRVQFKVTGTGTVHEITNIPMGRQK